MIKEKKLGFFTRGVISHAQLEKLSIKSNSYENKIIDFSNAYEWHKYLWRLFPGRPDDKRDFLFRWDNNSDKSVIHLLSKCEPKTLPKLGNWTTKKIFFPFQRGDFFQFQIRINPVKVICPEGKESRKRKRVPLFENSQIVSWFEKKGLQNGFKIFSEKIRLEKSPPIFCYKLKSERSFHHNVDITGILQVVEEDLFLQAITQGIGKGKAIGFGLLLLQPLPKSTLLSQGVL